MHDLQPVSDWIKDRSPTVGKTILYGYVYDNPRFPKSDSVKYRTLRALEEDDLQVIKSSIASIIRPSIVFYDYSSDNDTVSAYGVWLTRACSKVAHASFRGAANWLIPCRSGMMAMYIGNHHGDSPAVFDHERQAFIINQDFFNDYFCFMPGNPTEMFREFTKHIKQTNRIVKIVENGYVLCK